MALKPKMKVMSIKPLIILCFSAFVLWSTSSSSQTRLHPCIAENAVFQRGQPIPIFGDSSPAASIQVKWKGELHQTQADEQGRFFLQLPAEPAGGPHRLEIIAADTAIAFSNILVGDVWLASGQSNMEWTLRQSEDGAAEIASAAIPDIRFFTVPHTMAFTPQDQLSEPALWQLAAGEIRGNFSGVAYFFAKKVHQETGIPIGILHSSWGGTMIETWMSDAAMRPFGTYDFELDKLQAFPTPLKEVEREAQAIFQEWKDTYYKTGIGLDERWYERQSDLSAWKPLQVPGYWEDQLPEYADFDGAMWYRRAFDVPPSFLPHDIRLWLSQIDDHDMCWINGQYIGETFFSKTWTNYLIPQGLLKETDNEIVLRVYDVDGKGGLTGLDTYFDFYPEGDRSVRARLNGTWLVRTGARFDSPYPVPLSSTKFHPNDLPTLLYNSMLYPFKNIPIAGALWYQGESNKVNAFLYRELLPAMIQDWRQLWQAPELPFYFVQIANYGPLSEEAEESASAEVRESQFLARSVPHTGMACTIDIGDPEDIHPLNKRDVGERLARHALKHQYGQAHWVVDGPIYRQHIRKGSKLWLTFEHAEGLHTTDGQPPLAFDIATEDGPFRRAKAMLKNGQVILWHPEIKRPAHVRYAWGEAPEVNLFNGEGLPAYPFRTDERPGLTQGQKRNYK
jgi:sialate O-acetylesterase